MTDKPRKVQFSVAKTDEGWTIYKDDNAEGSFETQRAAFDNVVYVAVNILLQGHGLSISVSPDPAL